MIKIICVGKVKEKYLRDAISDYEKRISKYYKIDIIEVNDSNMKEEAIKIKQHIKSNDYVITLEIEGNMLTSIELANKIDKIEQPYRNILYFRYIRGYNLTEVSNEIDEEYDIEAHYNYLKEQEALKPEPLTKSGKQRKGAYIATIVSSEGEKVTAEKLSNGQIVYRGSNGRFIKK